MKRNAHFNPMTKEKRTLGGSEITLSKNISLGAG